VYVTTFCFSRSLQSVLEDDIFHEKQFKSHKKERRREEKRHLNKDFQFKDQAVKCYVCTYLL